MNISKSISKAVGYSVSSPWVTTVRYAKLKKPPPKVYREYTDAALWRKERGFETNPNKFGPLTNLPDYSFTDGRPAPLSQNLKKRLEKQKEFAEAIVRLSAEVDFAKDLYRKKQLDEEEIKRNIIGRKLKPKGEALLSKSSGNREERSFNRKR